MNKEFNVDEFEHIHSSWYIKKELAPYADFFQHHHPLFWYSILPVLVVLGDTVWVLVILRLLMYISTMAIAYITYSLGKRATGSKEAALLGVIFLLSNLIFRSNSIEIRPDIFMVLFALISASCLMDFLQTGKEKYILYAGFWSSISFLFLQKTIFLLLAYGIIFLLKIYQKKISLRSVCYFFICFSLPFLVLLLNFTIKGTLKDYFLTNWILNLYRLETFSAYWTCVKTLKYNAPFWFLIIIASVFILKNKTNSHLQVVLLIGITLFLCIILFVKRPHEQYFLFPISFLAIIAGYAFQRISHKYRLNEIQKLVAILVVMIIPLTYEMLKPYPSNAFQIKRADYVLENSKESDLVYDINRQFNLFRYDLHYFWYSGNIWGAVKIYNSIFNNKYIDYNNTDLIKSKQPKFISNFDVDMDKNGLKDMYTKTEYKGLFMRQVH